MRRIWKKQIENGTVNNCNSKASPGDTYSGRPRTQRTAENIGDVKNVMDRDASKRIGDDTVSPINSSRRNILAIPKSSWSRIKLELRYHPFKPVRRHELFPQDYQRRLDFANWVVSKSDQQLLQFLFSDEANFLLCGDVNSQNVRRYTPLKATDAVNGGRPEHFSVDKPTYSKKKLMDFCRVDRAGKFGLKYYQNQTMDGRAYFNITFCQS